ncbi:hypothetical protein ABH945_005192 [Paraburkholderia sp. GAS333]
MRQTKPPGGFPLSQFVIKADVCVNDTVLLLHGVRGRGVNVIICPTVLAHIDHGRHVGIALRVKGKAGGVRR